MKDSINKILKNAKNNRKTQKSQIYRKNYYALKKKTNIKYTSDQSIPKKSTSKLRLSQKLPRNSKITKDELKMEIKQLIKEEPANKQSTFQKDVPPKNIFKTSEHLSTT